MTMAFRLRIASRIERATASGEILGETHENRSCSIITVSTRPGSTLVTTMPWSLTSCREQT